MNAARETFWARGYLVVEDLFEPDELAFVRVAMETAHRLGELRFGFEWNLPEGALNQYAPIGGEVLLLRSQARLETIVGRELAPTCAYWRI